MDELEELGPVHHLVVQVRPDAATFTGEMATELASVAERRAIRVLDALNSEDIDHLAESMTVDTTGGVIVWKNSRTAPFAEAP